MPMKPRRAALFAMLSALPAAGCAITPIPLTEIEMQQHGAARLERWAEVRTPVTGTLTLPDAIARAIQYNLDHRVEIYETALRQAELGVSRAALLPQLAASAGQAHRDKPLASSSYNLVTNTQNFGFSTSQNDRLRTADLSISWNILDFGLSYVRARQTADKVLIAQENRRRVVHKLVSEVRVAYWRAYAADLARERLRKLERRAISALARARTQTADRTTSPAAAIAYRRELIETRRTLQELQRELVAAKIQLAALINEGPGAKFRLAPPKSPPALDAPAISDARLIAVALEKRPELREVAYRRRINAHEVDAALLELLPGIHLYAGNNVDSNSFLLNDQWVNWGVKASWNAMKLFQFPARRELIEAQDAALAQRDLALTLAIMTQIHVARARLSVMKRERETAREYAAIQRELVGHIRSEYAADKISEQTLLREELNDAVGQIRRLLADANVQSAYADFLAAVGVDPPNFTEELPPLEKISDISEVRARVYTASHMTTR